MCRRKAALVGGPDDFAIGKRYLHILYVAEQVRVLAVRHTEADGGDTSIQQLDSDDLPDSLVIMNCLCRREPLGSPVWGARAN